MFSDPHPEPGPERGPVGAALHWLGQGLGVAQPENEDFIKRVIGLPGDVVEIHQGQVYVNGEAVAEPYLNEEVDTRTSDRRRCLPACSSCWATTARIRATPGSRPQRG